MDVSQRIALSGARAHQAQLEVISNNLANAGTPGFQRFRPIFSDVGYQASLTAPVGPLGEDVRLTGVGEGVQVAELRPEFVPGTIQPTGNALDLALDGPGFFQVALPAGQVGYTRAGALRLDGAGQVVTPAGLTVRSVGGAPLIVPENTLSVRFDESGQLWAADESGEETLVGQLAFSRFANPQGLQPTGGGVWLATPQSGAPVAVAAGAEGGLAVVGGALETSNVDPADEFTRMIQAQRGYQLNLRLVQAWDEIERMANGMGQ